MEEFLIPFEVTAYRLAKDIGIHQTRVSEILRGNRRITANTALRLSKYFGDSAKFCLGLQDDYDLEEGVNAKKNSIDSIKRSTKLLRDEALAVRCNLQLSPNSSHMHKP